MKVIRLLVVGFFLSTLSMYCFSNVPDGMSLSTPMFNVRPLLAHEKKLDCTWVIESSNGFVVFDCNNPSLCEIIDETTLVLSYKKGHLAINNRRLAFDAIQIKAREGYLKFNTLDYDGTFVFARKDNDIYLVNHVDLEDYLFSVLRWESYSDWPLEVHWIFAIVFRTYVVNKVLEQRRKSEKHRQLFDIKSTNIHQTYKGRHSCDHLRQAIQDTRGIVLSYNDRPIVAMYDACCGGIVPSKIDSIDFDKAPYLARDYACNYCKKSKLYEWNLHYSLNDFEKFLKAELGVRYGHIKSVQVKKKNRGGIVNEVVVQASFRTIIITGKKIYSLLKKIKSLAFSVSKKGNKIYFQGKGFGHHLGLCQWGARAMIQEGWNYKDVLRFYYPGVKFMKIEVVNKRAA